MGSQQNQNYYPIQINNVQPSNFAQTVPFSLNFNNLRPSSSATFENVQPNAITIKSEMVATPTISTTTTNNYSTNITPDLAKKKCKNFLATLLKLSYHQPVQVSQSVKSLIQGLVDNDITPEQFTQKLQNELKSSPQPCLIPFLKKSLPYLQISLCQGESVIEGIKPPSLQALLLKQNNAEQMQSLINAINTVFNSNIGIGTNANQIPSNFNVHSQPPTYPTNLAQLQPSAFVTIASNVQQQQQQGLNIVVPPTIRYPTQQQQQQIIQQQPVVQLNPIQSLQLNNLQQRIGASSSATSLPIVCLNSNMGINLINAQNFKPIQLPPHHIQKVLPPNLNAQQPLPTFNQQQVVTHTFKMETLNEAPSPQREEDDINDVTAMGGVNLSEEKQKILSSTSELIGYKIRSCPDDNLLLDSSILSNKLDQSVKANGLEGYDPEVIKIISHAFEHKLRTMVAKLSIIAEHRTDIYKNDNKYEINSDVKAQFKFLEEIDTLEKKRKEDHEKEMLYRLAKKSKHEDAEQLKLKQKVKEMQIAQLEEMRQMEANMTALAAIGPRKKKLNVGGDGVTVTPPSVSSSNFAAGGGTLSELNEKQQTNLLALLANNPANVQLLGNNLNSGSIANLDVVKNILSSAASSNNNANNNNINNLDSSILRNRIKRVTLKDFIFMLEQDKDYRRSELLYECYFRLK